MPIEIREETADALTEYAEIPMAFTVRSILRVDCFDRGLPGIQSQEQAVDPPYIKNYDATGDTPLTWARRWDIANWGIFIARDEGELIGGAAVAWRTQNLNMLEGSDELALLWDLRVKPTRQRQGAGRQLLNHAASWARQRKCRTMKIETQNNNVAACRFYAACGSRLGAVHPGAYAHLPDEVMLLWYLDL